MLNINIFVLCLSIASSATISQKKWNLVFEDNFDGTELNKDVWEHEIDCWGGGNAEKQCFIEDASTLIVQNGLLTITPRYHGVDGYQGSYENCTCYSGGCPVDACVWRQPCTSAKIKTRRTSGYRWRYGRFEFRVRNPVGDYLWPALWMMPADSVYGGWAASGEVDIKESRGQLPFETDHAIHFGGSWPDNSFEHSGSIITGKNYQQEFFIIALEWDTNEMRWYIDDQLIWDRSLLRNFWSGIGQNPYTDIRQPFDQDFILLMHVSVGGNFFFDHGYGDFDQFRDPPTWSGQGLEIDYVKVYQ